MKILVSFLIFLILSLEGHRSHALICNQILTEKQTVQEFTGEVYDKILQSRKTQKAFSDTVDDLRNRGYEQNANLIERLKFLNDPKTNYKAKYSTIIEKQEEILKENIQKAKEENKIPQDIDNAIKLGVVFHKTEDFDRNNPDHWISLEPHEKIPPGYKIFEARSFFPGAALWSTLSRGHFPVLFTTGGFSEYSVHTPALQHDLLGHLPTYLLNIDYAISYMKVSQTIIKKYRELTEKHGKNYWSFIYKTGLFARVYMFNEGLVKSNPSVILDNHLLFGLEDNKEVPKPSLNFEDLKPETDDLDKLNKMLAQLIDLTPRVSKPIGGASLVSSVSRTPIANFGTYLSDTVYPKLLSWQKERDDSEQVHIVKNMISIIRGYYISMAHLDYDSLAEEIFKDKPTSGSAMFHFFSKEAGFYDETYGLIRLFGIFTHSISFGEDSLLHRFTEEGWDSPLPPETVKAK